MRLLCVLGYLVSAVSAQTLSFDAPRQEVTAKPDQNGLVVLFNFTNRSTEVAEIVSYDAKCPCLAAQVKGGKLRYQPGESGVIKGVFELQNFTGSIEKNIQLWMKGDAKESPSVELVAKVTIPERLHIKPLTLSWKVGDPLKQKVMKIHISEGDPFEILRVEGGAGNFTTELLKQEEKGHYVLKVTPVSTDVSKMARLQLYTSSKNFRFAKRGVFVMVKKH